MSGYGWTDDDADRDTPPRPRVVRNYDENDEKDQPGVPRHRED